MAETIPGGAYRLADGTWINAAGKPIAAPKGGVYKQREEPLPLAEDVFTDPDAKAGDKPLTAREIAKLERERAKAEKEAAKKAEG